MPTRTEVIQGLRARDELQNRDLALFLDYLEEVAGASSGTRDTILSSRRRIQDEITPQDFERLYNYLAELGTPANTFAAFSRVIRRRDILSRQLANFVMDEIDAASFAPQPPEMANIIQWYSAKDTSTLFQDAAGLTPVTGTGQRVGRVNNKGTAAPSFVSQLTGGERPLYTTGLTGASGEPFIDAENLGYKLFSESGFTSAYPNGMTVANVWWNREGGTKVAFNFPWAIDNDPLSDRTRGSRPAGGEYDIFVGNAGDGSVVTMTASTMSAAVVANDGISALENYSMNVGTNSPTPVAGQFPIIGNLVYLIGADTGNWSGGVGELIIYDKLLETDSFNALVAYIEATWPITFS